MASRVSIEELIHELGKLGVTDEKLVLSIVTLLDRYASRDERDAKEKSAERSRRYRQRKRDAASRDGRDVAKTLTSFLSESPSSPKEERKKKGKKRELVSLPDDWMPKEAHFESARVKFGKNREWVLDLADAMRHWALGKDDRKANWDQAFFGWMRREAKKGSSNGHGYKTGKERFREVIDQGLADAIERDRGGGGLQDTLRLLAKRESS